MAEEKRLWENLTRAASAYLLVRFRKETQQRKLAGLQLKAKLRGEQLAKHMQVKALNRLQTTIGLRYLGEAERRSGRRTKSASRSTAPMETGNSPPPPSA